MKKKKFITPKVRVIKLAAEELLAAGSGDPDIVNTENPITTNMKSGDYEDQTGNSSAWGTGSE